MKTGHILLVLSVFILFGIALAYFTYNRKKSYTCKSCAEGKKKRLIGEGDTQISVINPVTSLETIISEFGEDPTDKGVGQSNMQSKLNSVLADVEQRAGMVMPIPFTKKDKYGNIIETGQIDPS